jgi:2-keto-4-pentenoate hydratase/2-oxohepta-3-ene-1,7-dioic acid hydratase in catechol pathway
MRVARFVANGGPERTGEIRGDTVVAFESSTTVLDAVADPATGATGESFALDDVTLMAPLDPRMVVGVGLNYRDHAAETQSELPELPMLFFKGPASVVGPTDPIRRPRAVKKLDYEAELAAVLGDDGDVIGYTVANDVSARDYVPDPHMLFRHKAGDTFCPLGPWITTAADVPDAYDLAIQTWVDDELRQDARTSEIVMRTDTIVEFLRAVIEPKAGDVILTGTPAGVGARRTPPGFLVPGQVVRVEIEGLGWLNNPVVGA